jgi:hypothetical protein
MLAEPAVWDTELLAPLNAMVALAAGVELVGVLGVLGVDGVLGAVGVLPVPVELLPLLVVELTPVSSQPANTRHAVAMAAGIHENLNCITVYPVD